MKIRNTLIFVACLFCGCATYPLGMSRDEWETLPAEKQAEYRARQYEIDEQRRQQAAALRQQEAEQRAEAARVERERLAALYANARYGDIVHLTLGSGQLVDGRNRYRSEPASLDLVRGEAKTLELRGSNGNRHFVAEMVVRLSDDGNTLYLNETSVVQDRVVLVNQDWERGQNYSLQAFRTKFGAVLSGATATVRFKSVSGEAPRIIIEHR